MVIRKIWLQILVPPEKGGGEEAVWKFSENSSKMVHTIVPKFGESPLHCTGDSDECFLHSTDFADISPHSQLKYPDDYNMKLLYGGKIKHRKNCECCPVSQWLCDNCHPDICHPLFCDICHPPFCDICHPLFSDNCHPDICHPPKFIFDFFKLFSNSNIKKLSWRWSWMWYWRRWLTRS